MLSTIHQPLSHMPFLTRDRAGKRVLFYCTANEGDQFKAWKIWYVLGSGEPQRLETKMPVDANECSPTAWEDAEGWHVSFVGGGATSRMPLVLHHLSGPSLSLMNHIEPKGLTRAGFVARSMTAWTTGEDSISLIANGQLQLLDLPGEQFITRLSYIPDEPDELLVTIHAEGRDSTRKINIQNGKQGLVLVDGQDIYKSAILHGQVIHAEKFGGHEDRRLRFHTTHSLSRPHTHYRMRVVNDQNFRRIRRLNGLQTWGPGTVLHNLLASLGAKPDAGCQCGSRIQHMNTWGLEGCRERGDEIAGWLKEEAYRKWASHSASVGWKMIRQPWFNVSDPFGSIVDEALRLAAN